MKRIPQTQGSALIATMMVLAVIGTATGVAISMTTNQGRLTRSSVDYTKAIAIADSQMERLYADWRARMSLLSVGAKLTQAQLDQLTANMPGNMTVAGRSGCSRDSRRRLGLKARPGLSASYR